MGYVDITNLIKCGGGGGSDISNTAMYSNCTWCDLWNNKKNIDDSIRSIWYSDGKNEIEVKEEKKNAETESKVCSSGQHPEDGCIYW